MISMLVGGEVAAADDSPTADVSARLVYERDPAATSCPDEKAMRAEVIRRVGFNPFREDASRVIVCGVYQVGQILRARIEIGGDDDRLQAARELVSKRADCQELSEALAVALSIAINPVVFAVRTESKPEVEARPPEPEPAKRVDVETAPSFASAPTTIATAPAPSEAGRQLFVGADGAIAAGLNPGWAYATSIAIGFAGERYSAEVNLRLVAPSSVDVGGGSLRFWQWAVLVATCAHRGALSACLLGSGGAIHGTAKDLAISGSSTGALAAAGVRGAADYPLVGRQLRLRAAVDLTAALVRNHFTVGGKDAWVSPAGAAVLAVGIAGAFF